MVLVTYALGAKIVRRTIIKIWFAVVLLAIGYANVSFAQSKEPVELLDGNREKNKSPQEEIRLNKNYLKGYVLNTRSILTSPSGWGKSDWIRASLIVGITVGLYTYDQEIQNWMLKNRNNTTDEIAKFTRLFGDGGYTIPSLGVVYLYGHFFENEKARRTVLLSLESFVVSGIFTQAIKFAGHRHRPNTGDPCNTWDGPSFSTTHLSFPSGHSSSAFAIATVIASEYDDNVFIPPLAYSIATLTALSRVNDNAHWASDVFFGSVIGYFTATAIVGLHSNKKDGSLVAFPITDGRHTALLTSYKF